MVDNIYALANLKDWQGTLFEIKVNTKRFPIIEKGNVVRLRSIALNRVTLGLSETGKDCISLECDQFTNILLL